MSTTETKSEFLLLFRNTELEKRLSLEEMQEAMARLNSWLESGHAQGYIKGANPLGMEGKVISGGKSRSVTDGPFAEAKEAVGGYVLIAAADLDAAVEYARQWPLLDYEAAVEVRPIVALCPAMEAVGGEFVTAAAAHS
jgi:hypothetical protein